MACFFTSDTHFGHSNIIRYCKRPFANADEMDDVLVANWNSRVAKGDTVYHMGDFAFKDAEFAKAIRKRLNGNIRLILGNHDRLSYLSDPDFGFETVKYYDEISHNNQKIVLFHYPMRSWHKNMRGAWHLYGHTHGGVSPYGKSLEVGVDLWDYRPVTFDEIKAKMDTHSLVHEETGFYCDSCDKFPCECDDVREMNGVGIQASGSIVAG